MKVIKLGMTVYHTDIYSGQQPMEVVGIRKDQVELEGDYSGGVSWTNKQRNWETQSGVLFKKPPQVNKEQTLKINSEKLKKLRKVRGINQVALAQAAGVTQGFISQVEQNSRNVNYKTLEIIARELNCDINELIDESKSSDFVTLVRVCKSLSEDRVKALLEIAKLL